jgi:hypothetical protein
LLHRAFGVEFDSTSGCVVVVNHGDAAGSVVGLTLRTGGDSDAAVRFIVLLTIVPAFVRDSFWPCLLPDIRSARCHAFAGGSRDSLGWESGFLLSNYFRVFRVVTCRYLSLER